MGWMFPGTLSRAAVRCVLCAIPGTRWPLLLCTCSCALIVAGGVPLWRASWPRLVRRARPFGSLSMFRSAFLLLWCLPPPKGLSPLIYWPAARGTWRPAEKRAHGAAEGVPGSLRVVPVRGPARGLSLVGLSGFGLRLLALRWIGVWGPGHSHVKFPLPPVVGRGPWLVHWGCFVWTPTPPLSGRRTPRPGPACVFLCSPVLAGSGGLVCWALFGAPLLSYGRFVLLLCSAPSGLGLPSAHGLLEPITHALHQWLIELLERPEILSLHGSSS